MKRLAILRHAKSSWGDPSLDDFDRPLNDRGRATARRMGAEFAQRGMKFDLIVASTANRVRETIDGLRETFAFTAPVRFEGQLYLASEEQLLELVRSLPNAAEDVLIVGHNPGLERLILELSGDSDGRLRDEVANKFPTAGFALIELPADEWESLEAGSGRIVELILPRELD